MRARGVAKDDSTAELVRTGERNGYAFRISGCASDGNPNIQYQITARPLLKGMTVFCSDQSGIVKQDENDSTEKCVASGIPIG